MRSQKNCEALEAEVSIGMDGAGTPGEELADMMGIVNSMDEVARRNQGEKVSKMMLVHVSTHVLELQQYDFIL